MISFGGNFGRCCIRIEQKLNLAEGEYSEKRRLRGRGPYQPGFTRVERPPFTLTDHVCTGNVAIYRYDIMVCGRSLVQGRGRSLSRSISSSSSRAPSTREEKSMSIPLSSDKWWSTFIPCYFYNKSIIKNSEPSRCRAPILIPFNEKTNDRCSSVKTVYRIGMVLLLLQFSLIYTELSPTYPQILITQVCPTSEWPSFAVLSPRNFVVYPASICHVFLTSLWPTIQQSFVADLCSII